MSIDFGMDEPVHKSLRQGKDLGTHLVRRGRGNPQNCSSFGIRLRPVVVSLNKMYRYVSRGSMGVGVSP